MGKKTRAREEMAKERQPGWDEAFTRLAAIKKIAAKDADQYMLRLPPGLRDRVAQRAAENGRSMNTEIVDAIERHLSGADRVTQLWEFFGKHQENIEAVRWILPAIRLIESYLDDVRDSLSSLSEGTGVGFAPGRPPEVANTWADRNRPDTDLARLPLITADEVQIIKALLKVIGVEEETLLAILGAPRVEDIRGDETGLFENVSAGSRYLSGFDRAMKVLGELIERRSFTDDEDQTIKALIKGSGRGEEILAAMRWPTRWWFKSIDELHEAQRRWQRQRSRPFG